MTPEKHNSTQMKKTSLSKRQTTSGSKLTPF